MKAKARFTDSWMGIKENKLYEIEELDSGLIVKTDGYVVRFNEKYFKLVV